MISYLKVAPEDVEVKPNNKDKVELKRVDDDDDSADDDDDIADDSLDSATHDAWMKNMTDTWHWEIARTIYTSLEVQGQI